jgi:hypothetical protein
LTSSGLLSLSSEAADNPEHETDRNQLTGTSLVDVMQEQLPVPSLNKNFLEHKVSALDAEAQPVALLEASSPRSPSKVPSKPT